MIRDIKLSNLRDIVEGDIDARVPTTFESIIRHIGAYYLNLDLKRAMITYTFPESKVIAFVNRGLHNLPILYRLTMSGVISDVTFLKHLFGYVSLEKGCKKEVIKVDKYDTSNILALYLLDKEVDTLSIEGVSNSKQKDLSEVFSHDLSISRKEEVYHGIYTISSPNTQDSIPDSCLTALSHIYQAIIKSEPGFRVTHR